MNFTDAFSIGITKQGSLECNFKAFYSNLPFFAIFSEEGFIWVIKHQCNVSKCCYISQIDRWTKGWTEGWMNGEKKVAI